MKSKLGRKGENDMATQVMTEEERKRQEERRRSWLWPFMVDTCVIGATTGDGEKAISPQIAAGAMSGGNVPPSCTRVKSVAQLYKEQVRKYKKEAWARRIAKVKRFLMGVNPTKKINP